MKILIIANPRTGSTVLGRWLGLELKYNFLNEPYYNKSLITLNDNVVIKELYHHFNYENININEIMINFEKVIGLIRTDTIDCAISLIYANENNNNHVHGKYNISEKWIEKRQDKIQLISKSIEDNNQLIKNIPNILLCRYEKIFQEKLDLNRIKEYIGFSDDFKHTELLDLSNRYRNNKNKKIL